MLGVPGPKISRKTIAKQIAYGILPHNKQLQNLKDSMKKQ